MFAGVGKVLHCVLIVFDCLFTVAGKVVHCVLTVSTAYLQHMVRCSLLLD